MNRRSRQAHLSAPKLAWKLARKLSKASILLPLCAAFLSLAHANEPVAGMPVAGMPVAGIIDTPVVTDTAPSVEELKTQIRIEQKDLAKLGRKELEERAKKGDRLAQVALSADFADEAQQILFSPDAANAAISDALAWYSVAAQRGFPGAASIDRNGINVPPLRVVRNK